MVIEIFFNLESVNLIILTNGVKPNTSATNIIFIVFSDDQLVNSQNTFIHRN